MILTCVNEISRLCFFFYLGRKCPHILYFFHCKRMVNVIKLCLSTKQKTLRIGVFSQGLSSMNNR